MKKSRDLWSLGKLEDDNGVTVVRFRNIPPPESRRQWPKQFVVEWRFQNPNPYGLPDSAEHAVATEFEDQLRALEKPNEAFLALVSTGNGYREWYFYCGDLESMERRFNTEVAKGRVLPVELHVGDDPTWDVYFQFVSPFIHSVK